jgi:long-chain acyl-CoA synthetase
MVISTLVILCFDKDGFLKITDRKKEMFKTSGGKYIAPQLIENTMKQSRFSGDNGDGQKMPAAIYNLILILLKNGLLSIK